MMLKNQLDIIGRNEPITRKAKFWQSYVRALKGTDDMRAPDRTSSRPRGIFRPLLSDFPELSSGWPYGKSMYDEPIHAVDRIAVPGYRYMPVSRETYGYSPRNLYPAPYRPAHVYDAKKAWDDHLKRLADIDRLYPSKYPLSARHATPVKELSPFSSIPKDKIAYNYAGVPLYNRGGYTRRPLIELFEPVTSMPLSRLARDPWWWAYPSLRPYTLPYGWNKTPFYLRDSYLSPVKRTYLWGQHPIRPFDPLYFRVRDPKYALEQNLKRVEQSEDIFQLDESIAKKRAQIRFQRSLTPSLLLERASSPFLQRERGATPSRQFERALTPSFEGLPVYSPGVRRPLADFLQSLEEAPHSKISREPWWWSYHSLRPQVPQLKALPSHLRDSFLSPVKNTFHWYDRPFRPFGRYLAGPVPNAFYYYIWRRSVWENKLDDIDSRIRDALYGPIANPVYP